MSERLPLLVTGIVSMVIIIIISIITMLYQPPVDQVQPLPTPELPIAHIYTPSECMVEVSNHLKNGSRPYGKGVIVEHNGMTFVLTSSMIFTHNGEITIDYRNVRYAAEIIHDSEVWGLTALKCSLLSDTPSIEINDYPNHPPDTQVVVGNWGEVNTLEYMNDDWVIVDGNLPASATGMPTENAGELVGIIIGLNRANMKQAIMVGNRAIREFCDQVLRMNGLIVPDDAPDVFQLDMSDWSL